ncbi:unnamed protein product [Rhodiola kirilowii]
MPSSDKPYCINWAKSTDSGCDQYIFVPYLAPEVDSLHLREMFASTYQSVISATVAVDDKSSRSRGYGYVRFSDANERTRALTEVYGKYWLSRPVQFEVATPMQSAGNAHQHQQEYPSRAVELSERSSSNKAVHQGAQCENDPTNTTIYMFGVYSTVEDLRPRFSQFGVVKRITIPKGKRYAFVKFATRSEAEAAIEGLNGTVIRNQLVCLSWARSRAQRKSTNGNDQIQDDQPPQEQLSPREQQLRLKFQQHVTGLRRYHPAAEPIEMLRQRQRVLGWAGLDEAKTIRVDDMQDWMTEAYLHNCFAVTDEVVNVKIIRNEQTGKGYGFVEFKSCNTAEWVFHIYDDSGMPGTNLPYHINWPTSSAIDWLPSSDSGSEICIFVEDLASEVTDMDLRQTFSRNYESVIGAKVVVDVDTGRSEGYGFVRFSKEEERAKALAEMNGEYCLSRRMRLGVEKPKKSAGYEPQQQYPSREIVAEALHKAAQYENDPTNTTIFVGGIDSETTDADLRHPFSQFGDVQDIKIPTGNLWNWAFVQFATRSEAEAAIEGLNGTVIGNRAFHLSWSQNRANRQRRYDQLIQWNGGDGQSNNANADQHKQD